MKKMNIISISFILMLFIIGCSSNQIQLKEFKSKDAGFSVLMPGTPKLKTQTVNTAAGPVVVNMYNLKKNNIAYSVAYTIYPETAVAKRTSDQILDGARDGTVANVFGTLTSEQIISVNGYPAREITITIKGGGIKLRIVSVNNKLYIAQVVAAKDKIMQKNVGDFLDSFKLL